MILHRVLMGITLIFLIVTHGFAATEVVKLQRTSPQETARVLRSTFGRDLGIAEAPTINAIVIRGDDAVLAAEAVALARKLDRPGATLRFSVMAREHSREEHQQMEIHQRGITADARHRTGQNHETRVLIGSENHPLSLVDELTTPYTWDARRGPETVLIRKKAGLQISGRLADDGLVTISVWYGRGLGETSMQLISQVSGPLGQWLDLGTIGTDKASTSQAANLENPHRLGKSIQQRGEAKHFWVKVDRMPE